MQVATQICFDFFAPNANYNGPSRSWCIAPNVTAYGKVQFKLDKNRRRTDAGYAVSDLDL